MLGVVLLLGQMAVAMVTTAGERSPTADEPVYIGAGVAYLQRHDLSVNIEHPPLQKLLSGVPVYLDGVRLRPSDMRANQWGIGNHVIYHSGKDPARVLLLARLPVIALTLLFGLVVLAFATDLFGVGAGLFALALYAFSPDVIANGSLATNDVPVAGFMLTTVWLLWRARRRAGWWLPLAALAFGAALATKMTAMWLLPVVVLLAAQVPLGTPGPARGLRRAARRVLPVVVLTAISTAVLWVTYLAADPLLRHTGRQPSQAHLGWLQRTIVQVLPVPKAFTAGLTYQFTLQDTSYPTFLFGHTYLHGVWWYLPAALLVKTPLGLLLLWAAGVVILLAGLRRRRFAEPAYLLLGPALLFAVQWNSSRQYGTRYVVWLPMFLAIAAAGLVPLARRATPVGRWLHPKVPATACAVLLFWTAASSLSTFPYYLPYSNEAFGGPAHTCEYLFDAAADWGQDLRRVGTYLHDHERGRQVWLIYHGGGEPAAYGIEGTDPAGVPVAQVHGVLAASICQTNLLAEVYGPLIHGRRPVAVIGHTTAIYEIP